MTWHYIRRHDESGRQIAELEWAPRPGATYELHLDVDPSCQRKGIGRAMLLELEGVAGKNGGMSLYSFCAHDNLKARGFFEGVGFRRTFLQDFYGAGRHAYFLWKAIGAPL